jgi:DNA-binding CsgD family transcriptional regulator
MLERRVDASLFCFQPSRENLAKNSRQHFSARAGKTTKRTFPMTSKKTRNNQRPRRPATPRTPSPFDALLHCFPCPAWVEDAAGRVLARNSRHRAGRRPVNRVSYPLPPSTAHDAGAPHLVVFFPAKQAQQCHRRMVIAFLEQLLGARQTAPAPAAANGVAATGATDATDETHLFRLTSLTLRQREVFHKLSLGHSYKETSAHLGITHDGVRQHVVRLRRKLGVAHIPALRQRSKKRVT